MVKVGYLILLSKLDNDYLPETRTSFIQLPYNLPSHLTYINAKITLFPRLSFVYPYYQSFSCLGQPPSYFTQNAMLNPGKPCTPNTDKNQPKCIFFISATMGRVHPFFTRWPPQRPQRGSP